MFVIWFTITPRSLCLHRCQGVDFLFLLAHFTPCRSLAACYLGSHKRQRRRQRRLKHFDVNIIGFPTWRLISNILQLSACCALKWRREWCGLTLTPWELWSTQRHESSDKCNKTAVILFHEIVHKVIPKCSHFFNKNYLCNLVWAFTNTLQSLSPSCCANMCFHMVFFAIIP